MLGRRVLEPVVWRIHPALGAGSARFLGAPHRRGRKNANIVSFNGVALIGFLRADAEGKTDQTRFPDLALLRGMEL